VTPIGYFSSSPPNSLRAHKNHNKREKNGRGLGRQKQAGELHPQWSRQEWEKL
jgi:hypothetical protein